MTAILINLKPVIVHIHSSRLVGYISRGIILLVFEIETTKRSISP